MNPSMHRDDLADLVATIGSDNDVDTRIRCIELAIAATPSYGVSQIPEIVLTARRFARFAIEGTTPWLTRTNGTVTATEETDKLR